MESERDFLYAWYMRAVGPNYYPPPLTAEHVPHRRADCRRRLGDDHPGAAQCFHLIAGPALAAGDNRTGMTHPPARRRGAAGDEPDDRFLSPRRPQKIGAVLFPGPADLADHHEGLGLVIAEEHLE